MYEEVVTLWTYAYFTGSRSHHSNCFAWGSLLEVRIRALSFLELRFRFPLLFFVRLWPWSGASASPWSPAAFCIVTCILTIFTQNLNEETQPTAFTYYWITSRMSRITNDFEFIWWNSEISEYCVALMILADEYPEFILLLLFAACLFEAGRWWKFIAYSVQIFMVPIYKFFGSRRPRYSDSCDFHSICNPSWTLVFRRIIRPSFMFVPGYAILQLLRAPFRGRARPLLKSLPPPTLESQWDWKTLLTTCVMWLPLCRRNNRLRTLEYRQC